MTIEAQKTQSPAAVEIDGVLYRVCGEGRKQRRAGSIECGEAKQLTAEYWPRNDSYTDGFGLACLECSNKQQARYADRRATALVPIRVDDNVPLGDGGHCRGVWLEENGEQVPYLAIIEICRHWGLDIQGQTQRIQDDATLSEGFKVCKLHTLKGVRPVNALRYNLVPQWLMGIETAKMRNTERAAELAAFQKVGGQVLSDYLFGTKTAPPPPAERIKSDTMVVSSPDMQVTAYLDSALSKAFGPIYQAVSLLPGIDANTRKALTAVLGASRIEVEVPAPVINGDVYFGTLNSQIMIPALQCGEADDWELVPNLIHLLQTDWICLMFGESTEIAKRMKRHAGKNRIGKTTPARPSITSDAPKKLETLFRDRKPGGVIVVPNTKDLLVVRRAILPSLLTLPNHMPYSEAQERLRTGWLWE